MRTRLAFVLSLAAALVAGPLAVTPAQAAAPDHGTFSITETFVDSEACAAEGFDINVTQTEAFDFRVFFNPDGSVKQVILNNTYTADISANGHTIVERDRWQTFFYPDGSRLVGLTVHITGPGGIVMQDADQIVFAADGTVTYIRGPHPQFEGQSFCFALLP
jgi:hypothetical protein